MHRFFSKSSRDTKRLATQLARKGVRIFALTGELGSGKTTFVQGLARAFGIRRRITSPTFIIWNRYAIPKKPINRSTNNRLTNLYHVDLYRIHSSRELVNLGFKRMLQDKRNLVAIEWAERVKRLIPRSARWIVFRHGSHPQERTVVIK